MAGKAREADISCKPGVIWAGRHSRAGL